ncbi:MAG: sensor histidine kinase [Acidimicrobiales bacterium]
MASPGLFGLGDETMLGDGINLAALGLLVYGTDTEAHLGLVGPHLAALCLTVGATLGWLAWVASRRLGADFARWAALMSMACCGGALAAFAPVAMVWVGVAAVSANAGSRLQTAGIVTVSGPLAMLIAVPASGRPFGLVVSGVAVALAGTLVGASRRQSAQRAEQLAVLEVARDRAEVEGARAQLLEERNRLAREIHDVLAHTLSALSLQLEAMRTVVADHPGTDPAVSEQLERSQRLVREGLDEARTAVGALRDDVKPLAEQLERLCRQRQAELVVSGAARPLDAEVGVALYRVAQEALTNAVKHAPGASATVGLVFSDNSVTLRVENAAPSGVVHPLAAAGGGYGLQGVRERVSLLGGRVSAGPSVSGWRVEAEVPA